MSLSIEVIAAAPINVAEFVELVEQTFQRGWPALDVGVEARPRRAPLRFSIESTGEAGGSTDARGRLESRLRSHRVLVRMRSKTLSSSREFEAMFPGSVFRREVRRAVHQLFDEYLAESQVALQAELNAGVDRIEALLGQVTRLLNSNSSLLKELQRANAEIDWLRDEVDRLSAALVHVGPAGKPWPASWAARAVGALLLAAVSGGVSGYAQARTEQATKSPTVSIAVQLYEAADALDGCEIPSTR